MTKLYIVLHSFYLIFLSVPTSLAEVKDRASSAQPAVIEYNVDNFETELSSSPHFVMFYAPWCGHCKRLHPTWEELGEKYNKYRESVDYNKLTIGKVDCTKQTSVCASQEVNGYPTLKMFTKGSEGGVKYRGNRDLASLQNFIAEQLGLDIEIEAETPDAVSGLIEFTDSSFAESIKNGNFFVMFFAPWCGHCKRLEPTWSSLAKSFEHDASVVIGKFDCTKYKSICADFEVKGYPTLLWIQNGKTMAKYSGSRSHDDLKRFVVEQLGERKGDDAEADSVPVANSKETEPPIPSTVVTLTAENFENAIERGSTFVMFFAPWCGHCKRLAPIYEELGAKFLGVDGMTIAKVDCTDKINGQLCSTQKVGGFPTLYLYTNGEKVAEYEGNRKLELLMDFLTSRSRKDEL